MRALPALGLLSVLSISACGSNGTAPSPPTPPAGPTFTDIRVGVAGNGPTVIEPGKTVQLFAQSVMSDGSVQDITNTVTWETSNAAVATVSAAGVVTTRTEGDVNITATLVKTGTLALRVKIEDCRYTFSPESATFSPFAEQNASVQVTGSKATCSWTLSESASWIRILSGRTGVGSGIAFFEVSQNNYPSGRSTQLILSGDRGVTAAYRIDQAMPACSYVVSPESFTIVGESETHTFHVDVTPNDCRWTAVPDDWFEGDLYVHEWSQPQQGDKDITFDAFRRGPTPGPEHIKVCGMSGQTPCGVVLVTWLPR